ncbi:MAG: ATP-binding cassette domain-containing protein [Thermoleophilia bacterium]|nr:ATP-binding cassette domain-containing protein [Thermoleophilia bacterium]
MPDFSHASSAVYVEGVRKCFGKTLALQGVDLDVPRGTVFGLLGPNGSGKSTTVRILATLIRPDSGNAWVDGINVLTHANQVRERIGLTGQSAAVDDYLTGRENLRMFGRLSRLSSRDARSRAAELLEQFDLVEAADRPSKGYSGGMRRRLDLAASLMARPPILFLDEPTTGLDPRSRLTMWAVIQDLVDDGTTVLLTTQYLEEADRLARRLAVIDHGRVIAAGTPAELKARVGDESLELAVVNPADVERARLIVAREAADEPHVDADRRRISVAVEDGAHVLARVAHAIAEAGIPTDGMGLHRPTLDEVFLAITGHPAVDQDTEDVAP